MEREKGRRILSKGCGLLIFAIIIFTFIIQQAALGYYIDDSSAGDTTTDAPVYIPPDSGTYGAPTYDYGSAYTPTYDVGSTHTPIFDVDSIYPPSYDYDSTYTPSFDSGAYMPDVSGSYAPDYGSIYTPTDDVGDFNVPSGVYDVVTPYDFNAVDQDPGFIVSTPMDFNYGGGIDSGYFSSIEPQAPISFTPFTTVEPPSVDTWTGQDWGTTDLTEQTTFGTGDYGAEGIFTGWQADVYNKNVQESLGVFPSSSNLPEPTSTFAGPSESGWDYSGSIEWADDQQFDRKVAEIDRGIQNLQTELRLGDFAGAPGGLPSAGIPMTQLDLQPGKVFGDDRDTFGPYGSSGSQGAATFYQIVGESPSRLHGDGVLRVPIDNAHQRTLLGDKPLSEATEVWIDRHSGWVTLHDADGNQIGKQGYLDIKQTGDHSFKGNVHGDFDWHFESAELRKVIANDFGAQAFVENKLVFSNDIKRLDGEASLWAPITRVISPGEYDGKLNIRDGFFGIREYVERSNFIPTQAGIPIVSNQEQLLLDKGYWAPHNIKGQDLPSGIIGPEGLQRGLVLDSKHWFTDFNADRKLEPVGGAVFFRSNGNVDYMLTNPNVAPTTNPDTMLGESAEIRRISR